MWPSQVSPWENNDECHKINWHVRSAEYDQNPIIADPPPPSTGHCNDTMQVRVVQTLCTWWYFRLVPVMQARLVEHSLAALTLRPLSQLRNANFGA